MNELVMNFPLDSHSLFFLLEKYSMENLIAIKKVLNPFLLFVTYADLFSACLKNFKCGKIL